MLPAMNNFYYKKVKSSVVTLLTTSEKEEIFSKGKYARNVLALPDLVNCTFKRVFCMYFMSLVVVLHLDGP